MRKAFTVLALATLLFAGAGLVGCASSSGGGSGASGDVTAPCPFCKKTGMECKACKPGEPCAKCLECAKCPNCTPDKACPDCMKCMEQMAK